MAGITPSIVESAAVHEAAELRPPSPVTEPLWVRVVLIGVVIIVLVVMLILPLVSVGVEALREGFGAYKAALAEPEAWQAIRLTLITAAIAVPLNTIFGIAAAWCITKFKFRGKSFLLSLIDLPFAVSPVISGLVFVLIFGARGWLGNWVNQTYHWNLNLFGWHTTFSYTFRVIFALPGIVLATIFVTFPFVARELIPLMEAQGTDEELAARVLGASGWKTFLKVTLPNIKWGLIYGVILCNARAMGEFGAVAVVSANYAGQFTVPLAVEQMYHTQLTTAVPAFALASLLAVLGVITLIVKSMVELKYRKELAANRREPAAG